jgi:hypothetical protein
VLNKILFGSAQHEHADPAQRVLGIAALPNDSPVFASLIADDPAPEVRAAAAGRCTDLRALGAALETEREPQVRAAIGAALGKALANTPDMVVAHGMLAAATCPDAVRAAVAQHTRDEDRRRVAIGGIRDEAVLVDLALAAAHAPVRLAAAERVHAADQLRRLADGARDKDRGVARLARQRLDAIEHRAEQRTVADAILAEAEALAVQPGAIVSAAVELDRRWKALDLADDIERHARWVAVGARLQQRFEREADAQRAHTRFEQRLGEWLQTLHAVPTATALPGMRDELNALRTQATESHNAVALEKLAHAEQRIAQWERAAPALAAAEALVVEAETLAAGTPIDDAQLPVRWQKIDLAARTPALTRRFEAALLVIEQRRLAIVRANEQQEGAARQQLHALLHTAEQALAVGQLHEARAAADKTRALRPHAGTLPKPTLQRLSRVVQQMTELERWEKFGQQSARVQLCERAEALLTQTLSPTAAAREVQQLRADWKKLDEQHAGVPKPLWTRFDTACEKAYAPAARHFAEQAARYKQALKQREDFLAAAEAHAPGLLAEPRDWRAIERWLRETDTAWRSPTLGSVQEGAWKKLDARLKTTLAPLRDALGATRQHAKAERQALVNEAQALAANAMERDTPSRVKELQARWQAHAKATTLTQRDERELWESFRAACNAVFDARKKSRDAADERRHVQRRVFEALCEQLEQLSRTADTDDGQIRRAQRDLQEQWSQALRESGPVASPLESRFRAARGKVDELLRGRTRAKEAAVWRTLLDKERLCEELDALVVAGQGGDIEALQQRWSALPALAVAWEQKLAGRRDAALQAVAHADARAKLLKRIDESAAIRRDALLELELGLSIESPPDLLQQRRALQLKQLRDRFKRDDSGSTGALDQILLSWCALPGAADARDRGRAERVIAALERRR